MKSFRKYKNLLYFAFVAFSIALLVYTRFINLTWSLPYPMHPDERNMVDSILRLGCSDWTQIPTQLYRSLGYLMGISGFAYIPTATSSQQACLHPFFFAYGQLSLYLGWVIAHVIRIVSSNSALISFAQGAFALRIISAVASCITTLYMYRILVQLLGRRLKPLESICAYVMIILTPVMIQFAHFGTTESLLSMWYAISVYESIRLIETRTLSVRQLLWLGVITGCAVGTKLSGILTAGPPLFALLIWMIRKANETLSLYQHLSSTDETSILGVSTHMSQLILLKLARHKLKFLFACIIFALTAIVFVIITSPYNIIAWSDFMGTISYESGVGMGTYVPFYTRQFYLETPGIFQIVRILPYSHGILMSVAALVGFVTLSWKSSKNNLMRFSMLVVICANIFLFAKWTRFLAPLYPLVTVIGILGAIHVLGLITRFAKKRNQRAVYHIGLLLFTALVSVFGFATVSIYSMPDSRISASAWMYKHVKSGSYVLSETANVIDIPISNDEISPLRPPNYGIQNISFDFYELDTNPSLQTSLTDHIRRADYIVIPSRRIFYNHTCKPLTDVTTDVRQKSDFKFVDPRPMHSREKCIFLRAKYPKLNAYYDDLFGGKLGFVEVAKITSYPRITIFGHTLIEFPDENAEETSTVFDHPVIRIFKNMKDTRYE